MLVPKCSLQGKNNFNPTQLQRQSLLWSCRKVVQRFVQRFYNHTKSFTHTGKLKRTILFQKQLLGILREHPPYNLSKRKCYLSLNEKLEINSYKGNNVLNKSSELVKYRLKVQTPKQTYVTTT